MTSPLKKDLRRFIPSLGSSHFRLGGNSSEAFAINLIRSRSFFPLDRRLVSFVVFSYFIVQGLVFLFLVVWGGKLEIEAARLNRSFRQAFPLVSSKGEFKGHVDQLAQHVQASLAEINTAIAVAKDKFQIAGKLAGIVRTVPVRTWVTSIRLDASSRSMNIEASFLVDMADPYQLPAKDWIEALKKDPGFGPGLKKIEQVRSADTQKGSANLCLFEIRAEW